MRVKRISTENFAGLGTIDLRELDEHNDLFISGRNGIGKSQLLIAIGIAWRNTQGDYYRKYIGPHGSSAIIEVEFSLNPSEVEATKLLGDEAGVEISFSGSSLIAHFEMSKVRQGQSWWTDGSGDSSIGFIFSSDEMRSQLPFAAVTYLPADRMIERSPELTLSLASLARTKTHDLGQQTLEQATSDWNQVHNFDVFSSLTSLHYAGVLESGDGGQSSQSLNDFFAICDSFERATGKHIHIPALQPDGSIALQVELPSGDTHGISTLSSGELVALQLMHFMRLHYHRGSVLLVDEPEQHLHPSLQVEVVNSVRGASGAGQVWMATHSPNVLNAVATADVLILSRDPATHLVGVSLADNEPSKIELLRDIGVAPGLWIPGNYVAIVEGPTDQSYLRRLIPTETSSAYFVVAGDSSSVKSVSNRMTGYGTLPFIALCDRDGNSTAIRDSWNSMPTQFMWSGYAIESLFLDQQWLAATLGEIDARWDIRAVRTELDRVFDEQYDAAKERWIRKEAVRRVPSRDDHRRTVDADYEEAARVAMERAELIRAEQNALNISFEMEWKQDPLPFVDPKRAIRQFRSTVFSSVDALIGAMISKLERTPGLEPVDLRDLRIKINALR